MKKLSDIPPCGARNCEGEDVALKTTGQVLIDLGISRRSLEQLLERHPELKPMRFGHSFAWSGADIARVRETLASRRKQLEQQQHKETSSPSP